MAHDLILKHDENAQAKIYVPKNRLFKTCYNHLILKDTFSKQPICVVSLKSDLFYDRGKKPVQGNNQITFHVFITSS